MLDDSSNSNSNATNKAISDLELNELDRLANLLFTIGIIVAFQSTDITEESIVLKQAQQLSSQQESAFTYEIEKLLALANWIYLTAGLIFLGTSSTRLEEQIASMPANASLSNEESLSGRELVVIGNTFKAIGYALSATGFEIIADSIKREAGS